MVCNKPFTIGEGLICFQVCLERSHKTRCDKKEGNFNEPVNGIQSIVPNKTPLLMKRTSLKRGVCF
jgi:hypothetical protein